MIDMDINKVKERGRKRKRIGRETGCSPRVVRSRSCPINTGERLDRPGPPSWLTAESAHWPPALCYMTRGVQLDWQRETACTSQSVGEQARGGGLTDESALAASTHRGHKVAKNIHTRRQEESRAISLHRWAEGGNTPVLWLLSERKWGVVGWGELGGLECMLCAGWIFSTWRASGCFCQLHSWAARSQVVWPHDCPRGTVVREGEMGREREAGWERDREREKDRGPGTGPMQHAWWGVITNPIQSAVEFVNIHTFTFHCLSALWPKSSMLGECVFFSTHTHITDAFCPFRLQPGSNSLHCLGLWFAAGKSRFQALVGFHCRLYPFSTGDQVITMNKGTWLVASGVKAFSVAVTVWFD